MAHSNAGRRVHRWPAGQRVDGGLLSTCSNCGLTAHHEDVVHRGVLGVVQTYRTPAGVIVKRWSSPRGLATPVGGRLPECPKSPEGWDGWSPGT